MNQEMLETPHIRIDSEVTRRVRQHARAHMQAEVCGVLIGKASDGLIEIDAPIEAFSASQAGAHVTFTQAAWEAIYKVKDRTYPQERILGWYHSHPGFGVFLSAHDTFIHQNFFSSPDQIAWVYDPHSDEEGCFGWVQGSIRRLASIQVEDANGDGCEISKQQAATGMSVCKANMPSLPDGTGAEIALQELSNPPVSRFGITTPGKKSVAKWLHVIGSLLYAFFLIKRQSSHPEDAVSCPEEQPLTSIDLERGKATQQLSDESGK